LNAFLLNRQGVAAFLLFLLVTDGGCPGFVRRDHKMTTSQAVLLITVTGSREADRGVFAVWNDGMIVWSEDQIRGGPPYYMAHVDPAGVARTIDEISRGGRWIGEWRFGPDARWTHIQVRAGDELVADVGSWHEIAEASRGVVATATGNEALDNRQPADVLASQPADYRAFRARWDSVRNDMQKLIPASGTPPGLADAMHIPW
jgi:hypothetical protein